MRYNPREVALFWGASGSCRMGLHSSKKTIENYDNTARKKVYLLQFLCFLTSGFAHLAPYRMPLSGHANDKTAHLSVTDTGHFGGARHAGVNADIRVGIDIQNVKDAIPQPDIHAGVIPAS